MKILIVSFFDLEETTPRAFRAKSLTNSLKKLGHNVEFISARNFNGFDGSGKGKKLPSKFNRLVKSTLGSVLLRVVPDGKVFFESLKLFPKIKSKSVDLTISIGLPFSVHLVTWAALKLNRLTSNIVVADYGDPYSTNPVSKKPFYAKAMERFVLREFSYITVPIESAVAAYEGALITHDKVRVIPQGFDLKSDYSNNYKENPIPSFAFAGALYRKIRDPSFFFEALSEIEGEFVFHIYADLANTQTIDILDPYIKKMGHRIKLHAKIPRDECLEALSRMDFLINFANATSVQAPSKIVDYVLSSRPFITIDQRGFDMKVFMSFLEKDFSSFVKPDISDYDEMNVARKFSKLASPNADI